MNAIELSRFVIARDGPPANEAESEIIASALLAAVEEIQKAPDHNGPLCWDSLDEPCCTASAWKSAALKRLEEMR